MFESLKAFLILSREGIAIICLAKLESFQLLCMRRDSNNSLNNKEDKTEVFGRTGKSDCETYTGQIHHAYATIDGLKPTDQPASCFNVY